jgi:acetolactate synthase I/II/III large subunit
MSKLTGAHVVVKTLKAAGVEVIFTLSGNQILSVYDACLDEGVRVIDTRHEAAAVHAADAHARLTGRPSVGLVTAGPGLTNALTALATAQLSESPLLLLAGGSELARAGTGAFQEMDQVALAAPICKWAGLADSVLALPDLLIETVHVLQTGRPGAACLTLPVDLLTGSVNGAVIPDTSAFEVRPRPANPPDIRTAVDLLRSAKRPLVLGGPSLGWGQAGQRFRDFLATSRLPGFILESPRGLADPALHGLGPEFRQADLVLLFARQDFVAGFAAPWALAEQGQLIQVAPTPDDLGPNRVPDLGLVGDAPAVLDQLIGAISASGSSWFAAAPSQAVWVAHLQAQRAAGQARLANLEHRDNQPIHPLQVCTAVRARLQPDDVVAIDGGEFCQWARWAFGEGNQRVVLNGKIGMIGCALPFALGGRVAAPSARVVALLGDGTFGFHGFELDTAVRHNLPFVAVVGNDAAWAAERHSQRRIYGQDRLVASNLLATRYDEVARALGADGELVEHSEQLGPALDRAFASGRPTVLNVRIASIPSPAAGAV